MAVTSTIDEELNQFERDIRQLKIEYDQFFGGGRKRPPTEIEWRLEQMAKRYSERAGELKFGQRFRYNNLTQTYAKYKDIFRKKLAQREEGKITRHFGAAAKEIEAERAKQRANVREVEAAARAAAPFAREPGVERPAAVGASAGAGSEAGGAFRVVCSKPEAEGEKVAELYNAFRNAKQTAGESTDKLTQAGFTEFVLKKTRSLQKEKNCRDVEYVVELVEGQVKLKALVKG